MKISLENFYVDIGTKRVKRYVLYSESMLLFV